jgi:hypothetical protein
MSSNPTDETTSASLDPHFLDCKRTLQTFQSDRFRGSYSDLRNNPQFAAIGDFFFNRLYGPEDFTFRNVSIKKLHRILDGKVYAGMLKAVTLVIELHDLSDRLDDRMVELMLADGCAAPLTIARYRDAYRRLDNYDERIRQIELSCSAVRQFHRLSRKWVVGMSLKTVRATARLLGVGRIMDFVYEGYDAFRRIDAIDYFVETIDRRERAWHDDLWFGRGAEAPPRSG